MSVPSAEKILSLLVDLLADQHNVKVTYRIEKREQNIEGRKGEKQWKCS